MNARAAAARRALSEGRGGARSRRAWITGRRDHCHAGLPAECGYFDQSHFTKDFRKFTGGFPRGYLGYFPEAGPSDFAPNVVAFLQDRGGR
jgi:hypothetical protein